MKKLSHPHGVRLHEVIDDPIKDKLYLILDYVPGGPLMSGARRQPPIPEDKARRLFRDVVCPRPRQQQNLKTLEHCGSRRSPSIWSGCAQQPRKIRFSFLRWSDLLQDGAQQ